MIYGIKQISTEDKSEYDYVGRFYPDGNIGPDFNYVFNNEYVEKVEYFGFVDAEFQLFRSKLSETIGK